jgi:membrane-bound ClpP family serine protease
MIRTRHLRTAAVHVFEHTATVSVGLFLVILGFGLTFTVVFLLPGIIFLLVGVCMVVGGIFAHPARRSKHEVHKQR